MENEVVRGFIDRSELPVFEYRPDTCYMIHPLLTKDNYITYALCLANNKKLTEQEREEYTRLMYLYSEKENPNRKISNNNIDDANTNTDIREINIIE